MPWQDRTREAAYVSPSGARFPFDFIEANTEFDKHTTGFNFPGVPGTFVQDLGSSDRRYPMRCIFWGDDHDLQAEAFKTALRETGRGRLEHPRDGRVEVIPFGTVKTREDLVKGANQTVMEVTFWESTIVLYPSGKSDPGGQVLDSVSNALKASSATFAESIQTASAVDRASLRNRFSTSIGSIRGILGDVVSVDPSKLRSFNAVADSIISDLDSLIDVPAILANQLNILIQIPAASIATIASKADGYNAVIALFTSVGNSEGQLRASINAFRNDEIFTVGALSGLILSSVSAEFSTRSEAISAAADIADQFDILNDWREINYEGIV